MAASTGILLRPGNHIELGDGSSLLYFEKFLEANQAWTYLETLNKELSWTRPTLSVYGKKCEQPRETCYVADKGLPTYKYSGYEPIVHHWDEFPVLKSVADAVHSALPSCTFNSVLVNRYSSGNDYAAWHADDEKVYGATPTIASITFGAEREFLIRKKRSKRPAFIGENLDLSCRHSLQEQDRQPPLNAFEVLLAKPGLRQLNNVKRKLSTSSTDRMLVDDEKQQTRELYSFILKHGSMLVMQGFTQRDWEHSVPKRKKANGLRINLTFRYIISRL